MKKQYILPIVLFILSPSSAFANNIIAEEGTIITHCIYTYDKGNISEKQCLTQPPSLYLSNVSITPAHYRVNYTASSLIKDHKPILLSTISWKDTNNNSVHCAVQDNFQNRTNLQNFMYEYVRPVATKLTDHFNKWSQGFTTIDQNNGLDCQKIFLDLEIIM